MSTSAAIADSLLRQAFGGQARRSLPQRTARVCLGVSRLRVPVSHPLPHPPPYKVDPHPGKRWLKGKSLNKEQNEKRARARATGEIRRKCLSIGADHLVTLTYRDNVEDRDRVLTDLERLRRMLSRGGYSMPYVAVLECQNRGAIHPHLAVRGFQDIRLLRRCWYKIVGKAQGQVNVRGPRPGTSPVKLARYLSKYISKDIDSQPREFEEHRYFCSLGIACKAVVT